MADDAVGTTELRFEGNLAAPPPLPAESLAAATRLMQSGKLFRYVEAGAAIPEAALLEEEFAELLGARYCVAANSCGAALFLALKAAGVAPGDAVLMNAFTLAPAPGAIAHAGARPVLVDITPDLVIDLDDLAAKAAASGARYLLLSHMRGHLADLDAVSAVACAHGITIIEDCAHTTLARWGERLSGRFGIAGCFSAQSYKHLNGGEGGLIVTDDADLMARAVVLSGSYMLFDRHEAAPDASAFADAALDMPNMSGRMDELRAAVLRPQIAALGQAAARWNALHDTVAETLAASSALRLPHRPAAERYVASSIQFMAEGASAEAAERFVAACAARGVAIKWFGSAGPHGYTSRHAHWRWLGAQPLAKTDAVLAGLFDMRLPLAFDTDDARLIGTILAEEAEAVFARAEVAG